MEDSFADSCTFVCQHTFCWKCLVNFTDKEPGTVSTRSLPCPFCRKLTEDPNHERPVEELEMDVKQSFQSKRIINSFGPRTKDTDTQICTYCREEGETISASVWCSDCLDALCSRCARVHKRIPATQKHDVLVLSKEYIKKTRKIMCAEHPDEKAGYLCQNCSLAVCDKCCSVNHKNCDSVVTMESELASVKSALMESKDSLMAKLDDVKSDLEEKKLKATKVVQLCKQIELEIKSESQKLKDVIAVKEAELLEDLTTIADTELEKLETDIQTGKMAVQMYKQQSEVIDEAVKSDCEVDIYELYQVIAYEEIESVSDTETDTETKRTIDRMQLKKNTDKLMKRLNELQLGEIDVIYERRLGVMTTPVLRATIDVRATDDQNKAEPIDVMVLEVNGVDTVVVTDWNNSSVKSFYGTNTQSWHSKLSLDSYPWSLTQLKHNQVAVTVPLTRQIVAVEVNPDLKMLSAITTDKEYWGITCLSPTVLVAGSCNPPSVDILDMTGTVLRTLSPHVNDKVIIHGNEFLCTTKKDNILVSDWQSKSVLCLTPEGDVVFNYSPTGDTALKGPEGIAVTNTGDILVTDGPRNRVIHLTESGQFVRNILTSQGGLSSPRGLFVDNRRQLHVYLCMAGVVKVFKG